MTTPCPWGQIEEVTRINGHVSAVSTPSHGGIWIDTHAWQAIPAAARACFMYDNWAEEDCEEALALALLCDARVTCFSDIKLALPGLRFAHGEELRDYAIRLAETSYLARYRPIAGLLRQNSIEHTVNAALKQRVRQDFGDRMADRVTFITA